MKVSQYQTVLREDTGRTYLRRQKYLQFDNDNRLNTPDAIAKFAKEVLYLDVMAEEEVYQICVNTKMHVLGVFMVSHGTVSATILSPREILLRALLVGASSFILIHNHPSGDSMPSNDDIYSTQKVKDAGDLVGVKLADHIIIGKNYYSFREHSKL